MSGNFTRAVMTDARVVTTPARLPAARGFGGMSCTSTVVSPARPTLSITLPWSAQARDAVFAVLTPEGRLLTIYTPVDPDQEEDVVTPSLEVTWAMARATAQFDLSSSNFSAMPKGSTQPFAVFVEPGRYQFALVDSLSADLIRAADPKGTVHARAGCTIDFRPD